MLVNRVHRYCFVAIAAHNFLFFKTNWHKLAFFQSPSSVFAEKYFMEAVKPVIKRLFVFEEIRFFLVLREKLGRRRA
jgi:hypothetical protein